eukprot:3891001-Rhodomonas_salina.1
MTTVTVDQGDSDNSPHPPPEVGPGKYVLAGGRRSKPCTNVLILARTNSSTITHRYHLCVLCSAESSTFAKEL